MTDATPGEARLLSADDPPPFQVIPGSSPFLFTCDHAGRRFPRTLGTLDVGAADLETHIAWDIGAAGVARQLAARLNGWTILQTYSRLVIDCNRPPGAPDRIAPRSGGVEIPGNHDVTAAQAEQRVREIFQPYHNEIRIELDRRAATGQPTVLVSVHSFTPSLLGNARPWHAGVLYRDARIAVPLLDLLRSEPGLVVGDNQPYNVTDLTDHTVIEHGERRGLPHVELEIRQDLIADAAGQAEWADRFARLLPQVAAR